MGSVSFRRFRLLVPSFLLPVVVPFVLAVAVTGCGAPVEGLSGASESASHTQPVNLNTATLKELESVPGIGPALAQKIVEYRRNVHLFAEPADLADLSGIGAASVQPMLPFVVTKIDVNTAPVTWLEALPEIGDVRAHAIVDYRASNGAFANVDGLAMVPGLTREIVAAIRPYVRAGAVEPNPGSPLVNLNDAGLDELSVLPGIAYAKGAAIIQYRNEHGLFQSVDDLLDVPGVGPETLESVRPQATVKMPEALVGTFALEGSWTYDDGQGGHAAGRFPAQSVMLSLDRDRITGAETAEVIGAGFCSPNLACAPFTVHAQIGSQAANGTFTFQLSGTMPSQVGDWQVAPTDATEGTATSSTISAGFRATNGARVWAVQLTGYRIND